MNMLTFVRDISPTSEWSCGAGGSILAASWSHSLWMSPNAPSIWTRRWLYAPRVLALNDFTISGRDWRRQCVVGVYVKRRHVTKEGHANTSWYEWMSLLLLYSCCLPIELSNTSGEAVVAPLLLVADSTNHLQSRRRHTQHSKSGSFVFRVCLCGWMLMLSSSSTFLCRDHRQHYGIFC